MSDTKCMPKHTAPQPRYTLCVTGSFDGSDLQPTYSVFIRKAMPGGIDGPFNDRTDLGHCARRLADALGDYLDDRGFRPVSGAELTTRPGHDGTVDGELRIELAK